MSEPKSNSLKEVALWGAEQLDFHQIENPVREANWMASDLVQCALSDVKLNSIFISNNELDRYKNWIYRRTLNEPVQHITGKTEFYGLPIQMTQNVFIPRPETERIVDTVLALISSKDSTTILDMGTGSGCIAIALATQLPRSFITATDVSKIAIELAKKNANSLGLKNIIFKISNIFEKLPNCLFDFVISNPPYIPTEEMKQLTPEVLNHDPTIALTDGKDGLSFYKYFAANFYQLVAPAGKMILETGSHSHPQKAEQIFKENGFYTQFEKDYSGHPRVLIVTDNPLT